MKCVDILYYQFFQSGLNVQPEIQSLNLSTRHASTWLHFQLNLMAFVDNCKLPTFVDVVRPQ